MHLQNISSKNSGQTLVETMVAVFILTMGVTAAVGLANYALNTSTSIIKQIIATGLAREGIEVVKNMRDNNWLRTPIATNCYSFTGGSAKCYLDWLNPLGGGYDLSKSDSKFNNYLQFNGPNDVNSVFSLRNGGSNSNNVFGVEFSTATTSPTFVGFYNQVGNINGNAEYYRNVYVEQQNSPAQFNRTEYHRLLVKTQVWWVDRKCPRAQTYASASRSCRLELQTYLTNWKNY